MATTITEDIKKRINELYYEYHNKAKVARELGISAGTVSRYIIPNWQPIDIATVKHITHADLPDISEFTHMFAGDVAVWSELLVPTYDEGVEIRELWKELER